VHAYLSVTFIATQRPIFSEMGMFSGFAFKRDNKILVALTYCFSFAGFGLCLAALGPALIDLTTQTSSTLQHTGFSFAVRSIGYLAGSFAGPLYDIIPGNLAFGTAMNLIGIATAFIPSATTSIQLFAAVFFQGLCMGTCDTGGNVLIIYLFGKDVGPYMQLLHFSFAIGAAVSPLFLRLVEGNSTVAVGHGTYNAAFYIMSAYCILLGLILYMLKSPSMRKVGGDTNVSSSGESSKALQSDVSNRTIDSDLVESKKDLEISAEQSIVITSVQEPISTKKKLFFISLISCLLFLYVGCETGFGGYITSYGVIELGMPEGDAQLLTTAYWGAITAGRLAAVWISTVLVSEKYLGYMMVGACVACVFLFAAQNSVVGIWIGSVFYGLCMSAIFPTALAFAETCMPITGSYATLFIVGSASGEILLPLIMTLLIGAGPTDNPSEVVITNSIGPIIVLWVCLVGCLLNLVVFYYAVVYGRRLRAAFASLESKTTTDDGLKETETTKTKNDNYDFFNAEAASLEIADPTCNDLSS
jgi:MFS transporter, FHS family, Na+ dependent glucose transporter 1